MKELNAQRAKGKISAGEVIRQEKKLREQYKLTEKQVKTSRDAMKADAIVKTKNAKSTDLVTQATRRLAQAYTVLIAAQTATRAIATSVNNYGDLEEAIVKVEKTTGLAKDKLVELTEQIVTLSTDVTPTATNELLKMAEVAGQLGVNGTDNLLKMVAAADALEVSTNLAGEEAALLLTRILTMTGEGIPHIDSLASSVVSLGNNFAVSESEIVNMTKEVITGAQALNLGSAAAAAYGTVLKEMGQTGERSRSSMFELAQAIKSASRDGGDDLERLSKYSNLTADEIEKNLGERPEVVISALINGFADATQGGENLADILGAMGIKGKIAVTTLEALVTGNDRMNEAMTMSNEAFEAQNAHFVEAAKAYGTQNAAIGRLVNKFTALTASIGEAYSDETDSAIIKATDLIDDNGASVVELTNLMGELGEAIGETFGVLDNLTSVFTGASTEASILDTIILGVRVSFNALTAAANNVVFVFQNVVAGWMEIANTLNSDLVTDEALVNYRKGMAETRESVNRDLLDMLDASDDYHGKSSSGYRDLLDAVEKYGGSIEQLSAKEKEQLKLIVTRGTYLKEESGLHNKLTAALVTKNREIEVLTKSEKIRLDQAAKQKLLDETAVKSAAEYGQAKLKATILNGDFSNSVDEINKLLVVEEALYADGKITKAEMLDFKQRLIVATDAEVVAIGQVNRAMVEGKEASATFATEAAKLYAQYDAGKITIDGLVFAYNELKESYASNGLAMSGASEKTKLVTTEMANLSNAINKTELDIKKLTEAQANEALGSSELATITVKLTAEKAKLIDLQSTQTMLLEQESLIYPEVIALQKKYSDDLVTLTNSYQAGTISIGEYTAAKVELQQLLSGLGDTVNNNTNETDKNNEVVKTSTELTKKQTVALEKVNEQSAVNAGHAGASSALANLWNIKQKELNETLDYSALSYEELGAEMKNLNIELHDFEIAIADARYDTLGLMKPIDDMTIAINRRKQATIEETQALQNWIARVESGAYSMQQLGDMTQRTDEYFEHLSQQQLDPLIAAIEEARRKFSQLDNEINDSIGSIEDRLDAAKGNYEDIAKRGFQAEIDELNELINQARAYGNTDQLQRLQLAMRDLKAAQDLEFKQDFDKKAPKRDSSNPEEPDRGFGWKNRVTPESIEIKLTTPSGNANSVFVNDSESADNLLNSLTELGQINNEG